MAGKKFEKLSCFDSEFPEESPMKCSFCGRRDSEVEKLVAGPLKICGRVYICDRCAKQTIEIMERHSGDVQQHDAK